MFGEVFLMIFFVMLVLSLFSGGDSGCLLGLLKVLFLLFIFLLLLVLAIHSYYQPH